MHLVKLKTNASLFFIKLEKYRLVQIESIYRQQSKSDSNELFVFDELEYILRKGENISYQHFTLFPQCFQKTSRKPLSVCFVL